MSDLEPPPVIYNLDEESKAPRPLQEINEVLKVCTFGWFQSKILFASFFAFFSGLFVSNTTPYILPNAECDLDMNLLQKGVLNAAPFVGMVLICVLAGFLTDTFGRKPFLVWGYAGIGFFTIISSVSQTYEMLLFAKFCEGVLFASAVTAVMSYTSEFCHHSVRDRVMLLQSSYQSVSQVLLALISWGILTQEWKVKLLSGFIVLNTWNFYLLILSMFSVIAAILYCFLPESPKYLLTQHKYDEARETLIQIYTTNTGKDRDTFPYKDIWKNNLKTMDDNKKDGMKINLKSRLVIGLHNAKPIFVKPLGPHLALFAVINFCSLMLHNVIRLWYPQLSTIVEHYSSRSDPSQDLCVILDTYTQDLKQRAINISIAVAETCVPTKSGTETYINTIIIGCVCILPFMLSGALVNKVGKKNLLCVGGMATVGLTLGLRWASTKVQVVVLFASDMAMSQMIKSLLLTAAVEVFPTKARSLALSMIMMIGRAGTLVGNVTFPILLDIGCVVPFFTLAGLMIFVTTLSFFVPNKKKS